MRTVTDQSTTSIRPTHSRLWHGVTLGRAILGIRTNVLLIVASTMALTLPLAAGITTGHVAYYPLVSATDIQQASPYSGRIRRVKPDGSGDATNIQAGIDMANSGDTVLVASGLYKGNGNRNIDFKGKTITVLSASYYNPSVTDSSVIDCEKTNPAFRFHSHETNAATLEGFVVTNGWQPLALGGGIVCDSSSSPTIRSNTIRNCGVVMGGGGIACLHGASPVIVDNRIYSNSTSYEGGGIFCLSSLPVINGNKIHNNLANVDVGGGTGGGIYCQDCQWIDISNNVIHTNAGGAGIAAWSCSGTIINNTIVNQLRSGLFVISSSLTISGNELSASWSDGVGSAILCQQSQVSILNNYVHDNSTGDSPGEMFAIALSSSSHATISGNTISNNSRGGIYYQGDSTSTISNNTISNNGSPAIACLSSILITNNQVMNNTHRSSPSYVGGAGIACVSSRPTIKDNILVGNRNGRSGGGIACRASSARITDNTIVANISGRGLGIYIDSQSHPLLLNNIVANNQLNPDYPIYNDGGGIYSETSVLTVRCCDVFNNEKGQYIGLPDSTGKHGNISRDPLFCGPSYPQFTLHSDSPCRPEFCPWCGLIGAKPVGCGPANPDAVETPVQVSMLAQNVPNPFNPLTKIAFDIQRVSNVSLRVYSADGRLVRALLNEKRGPGRYEVVWDGKDGNGRAVPSGVYLCRMIAGSVNQTRKMILLR